MKLFPVKFSAGSIELDGIVRALDHYQRFKIEMVTNEPEPIVLGRSLKGEWKVIQRGQRLFTDQDFEKLGAAIEQELQKLHCMDHMLVLTDFSDAAQQAAEYAAGLTRQLKTSEMLLYHSYQSLPQPAIGSFPLAPGFVESSEKSLEKVVALKYHLRDMVSGHTTVMVRNDQRPLLEAVNTLIEQFRTGLVVMGITGKNNLEQVLIGSHTIELAKQCMAPLLIVPQGASFKPIEKVVFACDMKQVGQTIPIYAIRTLLHALGARLLILNVHDRSVRVDPEHIGELSQLQQLLDQEQPEYHYTDQGDIAKGIMDFADQHQADLVLTVPKAYGFFEGLFHQSVTRRLAYHSHLPLLLFRDED